MGLLDDAIREHLEFKRLRGADPGEVAREEHEALGPVHREESSVSAEHVDASEGIAEQLEQSTLPVEGSRLDPRQNFAHTGQETAELDMRTVLKTEQAARAAPVAGEDSLEWEVPGESPPESKQAAGGKPVEGTVDDAGKPVEDVLEKTPDFLRETPDQERLWFEQQAPRDFDFDK